MPSVSELLERESTTVDLEPGDFERLVRRRDRKRRNQRIGAGALAIILALVSFVALTRAFRTAERPADQPPAPKPPGIFSEVGGWITYGNRQGIWAVDPSRPDDPNSQIQLSTEIGTPLAWSTDGSKLLILSYERPGSPVPNRLYVLNADATETTLTTGCSYCIRGGSFSLDGSQVIYASPEGGGLPGTVVGSGVGRTSIYVVDAQGGTPRVLLAAGRRVLPSTGRMHGTWLSDPTYSPDGTQIAYFDHLLDNSSQLRVMNADGSGSRVLLDPAGLGKATGYHIYNLTWSPDGERLAWGGASGIFVVGADGSGLSLAIPDAGYPYWSPDGTRIAYRIYQGGRPNACPSCEIGTLEIAAPDGTHVQEFPSADPGPWNPLVQPEPEVAQVPAASEGLTLTSTLLLVLALLALVVGVLVIRRRMGRDAGNAI
jgi:Tol biopolymer transport system component